MSGAQVFWVVVRTWHIIDRFRGRKMTESKYYKLWDELSNMEDDYEKQWGMDDATKEALILWVAFHLAYAETCMINEVAL